MLCLLAQTCLVIDISTLLLTVCEANSSHWLTVLPSLSLELVPFGILHRPPAGSAALKSKRLREDLLGIEKAESQVIELQQKVDALSNQVQQLKRRKDQLETEVRRRPRANEFRVVRQICDMIEAFHAFLRVYSSVFRLGQKNPVYESEAIFSSL